MSKNRSSTHNRAHCCSLLGSHTMESEGLLLSWTHGHACFAFEFSRLYSGSILRFCFFWLSSNSVCKYKCLRWLRICLQSRRPRFHPWVRKIPWKKEWLPTPVFLPGRFHGQKSLEGYSLWSGKESDMTEWGNHNQWFSLFCSSYTELKSVIKRASSTCQDDSAGKE